MSGYKENSLQKKLTIAVNIIDPFVQESRNYTYGTNFSLQSFSTAQTRNFRLSVGYNFTKVAKKPILKIGK